MVARKCEMSTSMRYHHAEMRYISDPLPTATHVIAKRLGRRRPPPEMSATLNDG
jgi:predicted NAD/FAD-binding protein